MCAKSVAWLRFFLTDSVGKPDVATFRRRAKLHVAPQTPLCFITFNHFLVWSLLCEDRLTPNTFTSPTKGAMISPKREKSL